MALSRFQAFVTKWWLALRHNLPFAWVYGVNVIWWLTLDRRPFEDPAEFAGVAELEEAWPEIREEFDRLRAATHPDVRRHRPGAGQAGHRPVEGGTPLVLGSTIAHKPGRVSKNSRGPQPHRRSANSPSFITRTQSVPTVAHGPLRRRVAGAPRHRRTPGRPVRHPGWSATTLLAQRRSSGVRRHLPPHRLESQRRGAGGAVHRHRAAHATPLAAAVECGRSQTPQPHGTDTAPPSGATT